MRTDGEQYPMPQMSSNLFVSPELQEVYECYKQGYKAREVSLNIDIDCGSENEEYCRFSLLVLLPSVVQPLEEKELLKYIYIRCDRGLLASRPPPPRPGFRFLK